MATRQEIIFNSIITQAIQSDFGSIWRASDNQSRDTKQRMHFNKIASNLFVEYSKIYPTKKLKFSMTDLLFNQSQTINISILVEADADLFNDIEWSQLIDELKLKLHYTYSKANEAIQNATNVFPRICVENPYQEKINDLEATKDTIIVDSQPQKQIVEELIELAQASEEANYRIGDDSLRLARFPAIHVEPEVGEDIVITALIPTLDNYNKRVELAFVSKHKFFGWRVRHVSFVESQKQQIKDIHYQECLATIRVSTIVNNYQQGKKEKIIIESVKEVLEIITDQNAFCETGDFFSEE